MSDEKKRIRIWRAAPEAEAHIKLEEGSVTIAANSRTFINVDEGGITLRGDVSMASVGPGRRTGAFFIEQFEFADMIPKTMMTMIPSVLPWPPLGFLVSAVNGVTMALALLSN
jgi:hypothetical protein